jgi:hypothetical protein
VEREFVGTSINRESSNRCVRGNRGERWTHEPGYK